MDTQLNMNQFALYLNFHFSNPLKHFGFHKKLKPPKPILTAIKTVDIFREAFGGRFSSSFNKSHRQIRDTEEQFFTYAIPRCLMLVEYEHFYFSFLLVCACIAELVNYLEFNNNCCRFTCTGYKCFLAVFKRAFKDKFEEEGGWKGLLSFCKRYKDVYIRKEVYKSLTNCLTFGDRDHKKRIHHLIKKCALLRDICFKINDYELSLIVRDQDFLMDAKRDVVATKSTEGKDTPDTISVLYIESCATSDSLSIIEITANIKSLDMYRKTDLKPALDIESKANLESASAVQPVGDREYSSDNNSTPDLELTDIETNVDIEPSYIETKVDLLSFSDIDFKPDLKSSDIELYSGSSPDLESTSSDESTRDFKMLSDCVSTTLILLSESESSSADLNSLSEDKSGTDLNSLSEDKSGTDLNSLSGDKSVTELNSLSKNKYGTNLDSLPQDTSNTNVTSLSEDKSGSDLESLSEINYTVFDTSLSSNSDSLTDSESSTVSDDSSDTHLDESTRSPYSNPYTTDFDSDDDNSLWKQAYNEQMSKRVCPNCNLRCLEYARSLIKKLLDSSLITTR